jgi:hypothetical protein
VLFHQFVNSTYIVFLQLVDTLQFAWSSSKGSLKMKKMNFIAAGLISLMFVTLSANPTRTAPFSGAFSPVIDTNVISATHHCWQSPSGKSVCAYRNYNYRHPYNQPFGDYPANSYGDYRFHYQPYGYYPAYLYQAERPYHPHEFYLPNEYDHPDGLYNESAFYYGDVL